MTFGPLAGVAAFAVVLLLILAQVPVAVAMGLVFWRKRYLSRSR